MHTQYPTKLFHVIKINSAPHLVVYKMAKKQKPHITGHMKDAFLTYICCKQVFKANRNKQMQLKKKSAGIIQKTFT